MATVDDLFGNILKNMVIYLAMKVGAGNLFLLCSKCCSCKKYCVRKEIAEQQVLNGLVKQLTAAKMQSVVPIDENNETDMIIHKNTEFVAHEEDHWILSVV